MIIVESTSIVINTEEVTRGTLIWAKHSTWDEGRTGIVKEATEKIITVMFLPSMQNVQNHYMIPVSELAAGAWQVRYSSDGLQNVIAFGIDDDGSGE